MHIIRAAQPEDFEEVFALLGQLWPDKPLHREPLHNIFDQALTSDNEVYLCACRGAKVVGFCTLTIKSSLWQEGDLGYVGNLVVDSNYRRSGIGTALLEKAAEIAGQRHCRCLELDSGFHRPAAHRFYESRGFEKRGFLFSRIL
jgi:ribosomal protein S18 acetylase RimI-like enzyme